MAHMMRNLEAALDRVTERDVVVGAGLYGDYHRLLAELADLYGFPLSATCGAFAVLSPRMRIEQNFRSLVTCMIGVNAGLPAEAINAGTFNRARDAAVPILSGKADFADIVKGQKVTAFRHNLLFPKTSNRVTIDGHMVGIMLGKPSMTMEQALFAMKKTTVKTPTKLYTHFERAFLRFCNRVELDLPAHWVQAILWHSKRRLQRAGQELDWAMPPADRIEPYAPGLRQPS